MERKDKPQFKEQQPKVWGISAAQAGGMFMITADGEIIKSLKGLLAKMTRI